MDSATPSPVERLERVRAEFDDIVRTDPRRLTELATWGRDRYMAMCGDYAAAEKQRRLLCIAAVIKQLKAGRLRAGGKGYYQPAVQVFRGRFPGRAWARLQPGSSELRRLEDAYQRRVQAARKRQRPEPPRPEVPIELRRPITNVALRYALDERDRIKSGRTEVLSAKPRAGWVLGDLQVHYVVPEAAVQQPTPPWSLDWRYLSDLPAYDLLAISITRLAALRDCKSLEPLLTWTTGIFTRPTATNDEVRQEAYLDNMVPSKVADDSGLPALDPAAFNPELAEMMLKVVTGYLSPARIYFDEKGALRVSGQATAATYYAAIEDLLNQFFAHLALLKETSRGHRLAIPPAKAEPLNTLWHRVQLTVGTMRAAACREANPYTPEQEKKLNKEGTLAFQQLRVHPNFVPVDALLAEIMFTIPAEASAGVVRYRREVIERLASLRRALCTHAGTAPPSEVAATNKEADAALQRALTAEIKPDGWNVKDLCKQARVSPPTVKRIREASGVRGPESGEHDFRYGPDDLAIMISTAASKPSSPGWSRAAKEWPAFLVTETTPPPTDE